MRQLKEEDAELSVLSAGGIYTISDHVIELDPMEVEVDESVNVRPFTAKHGSSDDEQTAVQALADSIQAEGQIEPVEVRRVNGKLHITVGTRRRNAVMLINMSAAEGVSPVRLRAIVKEDVSDESAFRRAMFENLHRKSMSPMDMAANVKAIRERFAWTGKAGTKWVADYLKVSPATVTQHEKLLTLEPEFQEKVHGGVMSADAAFKLLDVKPELRGEVLEKAGAEVIPAVTPVKGKITAKGKAKIKARNTGKIQAKHVKKAARNTEGATDKAQAMNRKEIVEFFAEIRDSPLYGYPDGQVRAFASYFTEKFVAGLGSERTMYKYFDAMVERAGRGTVVSAKDGVTGEEIMPRATVNKAHRKRPTAMNKRPSKSTSPPA